MFMGKIKVGQLDLYAELKPILDSIDREQFAAKERGLDKAADYFVQKLEIATPTREEYPKGETEKTAHAWVRSDKYTSVRYVNNTRLNKQRIPIVNLLEFGKKGKPFVRKTFEAEKANIINIITGELKK